MRIREFVVAAAFTVAQTAVIFPPPATAQTPQQLDWCNDKGSPTPDMRIGGCTALIQSGNYSGHNLATAFLNRGVGHHRKNEYDLAIADYNQSIRLNPNNAATYYNRGHAYFRKENYDLAIADFSQAIRLNPKEARAFYNRGVARGAKQNYDDAIADYNETIRLDPNFANAFYNRGFAWEYKNKPQKALADYKTFTRLSPSNPDGPEAIKRITQVLAGRKPDSR
jgi:tetratricopeptide (TPR) repeat protein